MGKYFKKRSFFLLCSGMTVLIAVILFFVVLFWPQDNDHLVARVKVKPGMSLSGISNMLYENNIISNKLMFQWAVKILGKEKNIPIGTFRLVKAKSNYKIIDQLVYGAPEVIKVRLLEGWDIEKMAEYLSEKMDFDKTEFIHLTKDKKFLERNQIDANTLEGYLHPDTYHFFKGDTPESVLVYLIKQYKLFWTRSFKNRAELLGFTENEILTLASIIEGEALYDDERPKISAVYHNRLKLNMKLQADPTIQYIIDDAPRRLLNKDLRIKSPYNTYLHKGLPPGPINSPGKKSILAALYPEENDFLYFVANGEGYHSFSTNERDHNIAKRRLQKIRRKFKKKQKIK